MVSLVRSSFPPSEPNAGQTGFYLFFSVKFVLFFQPRFRYEVYMDENGDAEGNYTLVSRRRHPDAGKGYGLFPVGRFAKLRNLTTKNPVCLEKTITVAEGKGVARRS